MAEFESAEESSVLKASFRQSRASSALNIFSIITQDVFCITESATVNSFRLASYFELKERTLLIEVYK